MIESGDDVANATAARLASEFLGNKRVNAMWARAVAGKLVTVVLTSMNSVLKMMDFVFKLMMFFANSEATRFRAVSAGGGGLMGGVHLAPAVFARANGDVAVFNYVNATRVYEVDLAKECSGLQLGVTAVLDRVGCMDAWSGGAAGDD